jgi:hypothetical protein
MHQLSKDWLTEKHLDPEYKQYVLLAYLGEVDAQFRQRKVYPALSELIDHYRNLKTLKAQADLLQQAFPQQLKGIDPQQWKLRYEPSESLQPELEALDEIIRFSLPQMEQRLEHGKQRFEEIEQSLHLSPVGVRPLYTGEGYLMFCLHRVAEIQVFNYSMRLYEKPDGAYRSMYTEKIWALPRSLQHTPETIKLELLQRRPDWVNPATFVLETEAEHPFEAAIFPIGKRMLMRELSRA